MQPCVLFLTSNGWGLGHLTRSMAVARRLPADIRSVFLTMSQALPIVVAQGFLAEYVASPAYSRLPTSTWNAMYASRLHHLFEVYDPAAVVFDGTFPYGGLRRAIDTDDRRAFVWSRRAMWRADYKDDALRMASSFDLVIEPGEFAAAADRGATVRARGDVRVVDPIVLLDEDDLLSRRAAESELGLAEGRTNVLVQLGAGNLNDITSEVGMIVQRLVRLPATQVVVAESPISATPVDLPDGVVRARTYPLARLARAFDFTVTATGYNSFHECVAFGLPGLYVPNEQTMADDQLARAVYAEQAGVGLTWHPKTAARLDEMLEHLTDPGLRESMAERARRAAPRNGAAAAADALAELVGHRLGVAS